MKEDRIIAGEPIELDPRELLGFSQVAKVSGAKGKPDDLGRLLSKIGSGETPGTQKPDDLSRLLSKIGETPLGDRKWDYLARLLSKIGEVDNPPVAASR